MALAYRSITEDRSLQVARAFVKAVLNKINEIDSTLFVPHTSAIKNLANRYSPRVEMEDMQLVSEKVVEILDPAVEN